MTVVALSHLERIDRISTLLRARPLHTLAVRGGTTAPPIEAAVLVPLHLTAAEGPLHLWLLKRPDTMRTHAGQIAFPGGRRDPEDIDTEATALREAHEEIGLEPRLARVLGPFDRLVTPSGFSISPHVALIEPSFVPVPNPAEVDLVFRAPLATFTTEPRGVYPRIGYDIEEQFVWGATFHIARSLALLLEGEGLL